METCDNITLSDIDKVVDNKSFLVEDPVLLILYRYLRKRNMKLFIGAVELGANEEFQFVLKTANIYRRMGCDILALSLIKNWDFSIDRAAMSSGLVSFRGSQEGSVASTPIPSNTKPSISAISEYTSGGGSILITRSSEKLLLPEGILFEEMQLRPQRLLQSHHLLCLR